MPAKPMLDDVELQQVQKIDTEEDQVLTQHRVPVLEGDFFQGLGRCATRVSLTGVMTGPEVPDGLKKLRDKFRGAEPVSFVADIASATKVDQVLIEEMGVRELAGKSERFEYALTLREFIPPPRPEVIPPPPPPPPPSVTTGTLVVEVIVEGQPNFDFSEVTLTVEGTQDDRTALSRTLTNRENNVWTEENMPPGQYTAKAVTVNPPMTDSAEATIRAGQTTRASITLKPGAVIAKIFIVHFRFDNAFVEPCMRAVLKQVADYAKDHPDEKLVIVGHTDEVGSPSDLTASDPYNQSLSERRARSVFAFLTFGIDANASTTEWNALRQKQTGITTLGDKWGARQYQYMLQDLGFYSGNVDGIHGTTTDDAVQAFRKAKGLPPGTTVDDAVWQALITDYLGQDKFAVPPNQFLPNKNGCDSGILKWLGCASQDPVKNVRTAWRPNRRVELLLVRVAKLPCQEPQPDTFNLPTSGAVNASWCLGPGDKTKRACFVVKHLPPGGKPKKDEWTRQPAEPGSITVRGSIKFEDGTPLANAKYVLIAPDGEYLHTDASGNPDLGEVPQGPQRGRPIPGRTDANGVFSYPRQTPVGVYTLEIYEAVIVRLADEPGMEAKGNVVCKRLDGTSDFDVLVCGSVATTFDLQVTGATQVGGAASTTFVATKATSGDVIITAVTPQGTCAAPRSIGWSGGLPVPERPLQRRVPRTATGQTTVTATMSPSGITRSVDIFIVRLTLDVDADRDGVVEDGATGKDTWEFGAGKKGAIILCNCDNDDKPAGNTEIDNQNFVVDGPADVSDLASLVVRASGALPAGVSISLSISDKEKVRVFDQRSSSATAIIGPGPAFPGEVAITNPQTADVELAVEAIRYPDAGFDGLIRLTLALKEGSAEIARDEAVVRVDPWVMPSHMDETIELYVVETGDNVAFVSEIEAIATAAGVPLKKTSNSDRWMQDTMEIGYSRMPGKENNVVFKAVRGRGLGPYARTNLLGPDFGFIEVSTPTGANTFDSHGNLEVSPPVQVGGKNFQFGRIYYGRGRPTEPFNSEVEQFLIAQEIQKPFKIDTDWLAVGHVDEIISFVPSNAGGRDFRMLFSDTKGTIRILTDLKNAGHGDLKLFEGHAEAISVKDLLDELGKKSVGKLGWANDFCQARLDGVKAQIKAGLGLSDSDIVLIPALFIENPFSPRRVDPASLPEFDALIPGMVNLLLINKPSFSDIQLVIAKPFGPEFGGVDQLEQDVRNKLSPLGYAAGQLRFVDDYDTYHLKLGEVHCATNSKRRPPTKPWWEQTDF